MGAIRLHFGGRSMLDVVGRGRVLGVILLLTGLAMPLPGCGAGGSDEDGLPGGSQTLAGLTITTLDLPPATAGESFAVVQLEVHGASSAALEWSLWDGALPDGLRLDREGRIFGTPQQAGFHTFTVRARDGHLAGTRTLAVAVDDFGVVAQSGLVVGEAWSGRLVTLRAAGQNGPVAFDMASNESGGVLLGIDEASGAASYRPGEVLVDAAEDVVRATDATTGRVHELALTVRGDPTADCAAEFGSTDVWYVDARRRHGTHPFASDFQAALESVGLRGGDTDMVGTQADGLAETWIRLELLRRLNGYYRRSADGSAGAEGFAISFPFHEPGPGYTKPVPGSWMHGAPHHFNVIAVVDGASTGVVGTAFVDDIVNGMHENDTSTGVVQLGVFVNVIARYFNTVYDHASLRDAPICEGDVPALHALLHGLPSPGGRYAEIREVGRDFARVLATIVAHEIGHSLGLEHTPRADADSIMNSSASIAPWSDPAFLPEDVARLQVRLPGPGRAVAGVQAPGKQGIAAAALPEGGVRACDGRTCNLCLPAGVDLKPSRGPAGDAVRAPRSAP